MDDDNPFYTDVYRRIFQRIGIPVKKKLANFLVTEDAIIKPGFNSIYFLTNTLIA